MPAEPDEVRNEPADRPPATTTNAQGAPTADQRPQPRPEPGSLFARPPEAPAEAPTGGEARAAAVHGTETPRSERPLPGTPVPGTPVPGTPVAGTPVAGTSNHQPISRRGFLTIAGGAAAAAAGGALAWNALVRDHLEDAVSSTAPGSVPGSIPGQGGTSRAGAAPGRTLIVLQLAGGNDGLNTLVPVHDGRYFDARPALHVKEADVVTIDGATYGLHPGLAPLAQFWNGGRIAAVDAVGFTQGQSRSHFQAIDLWWSAQPGQPRTTGWLGRWLDRSGDLTNPLRAISLGAPSPSLTGDRSLSTTVLDPASFMLMAPKGASADQLAKAFEATASPQSNDPDVAAVQASIPSALDAVELLAKVTGKGNPPTPTTARQATPGRPAAAGRGDIGELLDVAAGIIDLQIGTQVVVIGVGGFDTHANQATVQPQLLSDLGKGLSEFMTVLDQRGRGDDVMVMTMSEFGRRVAENGSGTDHGKGGVQFLAGKAVKGKQVIGQADLAHLDEGDVPIAVDTRSLYAAALDWLCGDTQLTDDILGGSFDRLGLI